MRNLVPAALLLAAAALPLIFRNSVSTIRTGNELAALSWVLCESSGPGEYSLYPLSFRIGVTDQGTTAVIQGSPATRPPDERLAWNVPWPAGYTQNGSTVTIRFGEAP